jgi:hypothetical protein
MVMIVGSKLHVGREFYRGGPKFSEAVAIKFYEDTKFSVDKM